MKKNWFFYSIAVLALSACTNDDVLEENTASNQPKEIAFQAFATPTTRAAVDGTAFPTTLDMMVTAYQVSATGGSAGVYFDATPFKYQYVGGSASGTGSYWGGDPAKFWPLTGAYINFLAIANANANNTTGVTWGSNKANGVEIVMSDNSSDQRDLMYAIGNGEVTQSGNALTFPTKIDMEFKHAQAWIDFKVKGKTTAESAIRINSITLNGAKYDGTYTVTHTGYNASTGQSVAGAWTGLGDAQNIAVPGWSPTTLTTSFATVGNGLMIVPDDNAGTGDFTSFTISYTFDSKDYTYTYTPAATNVDQKKHYIYEITFELHEVFVNPTVEDWADQSAQGVTI
jgi:hypothetical protein